MNVVIVAPLLSVTGYGVHSRQIFRWAESKGWNIHCQIVPWGMCTYYVDRNAEGGLIGRIMDKTAPFHPNLSPDLSLQIQLPDEWNPGMAKVNIGVTAGVEATKCSDAWIECCKKMSHVIVPSTFTRGVFINSGLEPERISAVPEGYTCTFNETSETKDLNGFLDSLQTNFNFLVFGQLTGHTPESDRKNTFYNIKWLAETFRNDPDVGILVKTNMGRLTVQDREQTTATFRALINEVRQGPYPKFYLAHGLMNTDEICALYQHEKIKALVAPTRGEGWGLPILDAAVCGLPIIATNYSGHLDFLKDVKFLSLDYNKINVPPEKLDGRVWVEGAQWVDINEGHFKSRLTKFRKSPGLPTEWAKNSAPNVERKFSVQNIFCVYDEVVGGIIDGS